MLQKLVSLTVFVSAGVCCAVLGFLLLSDKTAKAGIATLSFNSTNINLPDISLAKSRAISIPNLFQPLESKAQDAASVLATAIATAANNAQSAAGSVATAVIDAQAIQALIPSYSLGTKKLCVQLDTDTKCTNFPLNMSSIIPEGAVSFIGDEVQELLPLGGILSKVTPANIEYCFRFGLGFILIMGAILICLLFTRLFTWVHRLVRFGVCLVSGVACCVLLLIPTVILHEVQRHILKLQPYISVEKGVATSYCWGSFACGVIMLLVTTTAVFM